VPDTNKIFPNFTQMKTRNYYKTLSTKKYPYVFDIINIAEISWVDNECDVGHDIFLIMLF
jgi:hypothetical protein